MLKGQRVGPGFAWSVNEVDRLRLRLTMTLLGRSFAVFCDRYIIVFESA